jgi:serine/threonine-protein kinase
MRRLEPGSFIGKYRIVRYLDEGGMGVLYEAAHPVLANRLVVKTIRRREDGGDEASDRFRVEALSASRLRDDRLPRIFDIDTLDDGTQYLVMEFLDGENLAQRVLRGPLEPGYAARVVFEVLEVLARVHRLGIVHRDIKPANIFLAQSDLLGEIPKLLDFGVAHIAALDAAKPQLMIGTPAYMAPEQTNGGAIGPWTDIFAAGVVLFELVAGTGQRPWVVGSAPAYYVALAKREPPRSLAAVAKQVPRALSEAVARALSHDPAARFADARAFARALEPCAIPRAALYRAAQAHAQAHVQVPAGADTVTVVTAVAPVLSTQETVVTVIGPPSSATPSAGSPLPVTERPSQAGISSQRMAGLRAQLERLSPSPGHSHAPLETTEREPAVRLHSGEQRPVTLVWLALQLQPAGEALLSADEVEELARPFEGMLRSELERRGGRVLPQPGGLMAVFGYDAVHEEDAERAAMAALSVSQRRVEAGRLLDDVGYALLTRAGLHSGFVERGAGDPLAPLTGDALDVVKQLADQAPINGILVSDVALEQLGARFAARPVGKLTLADREVPIETHELLGRDATRWDAGTGGADDPRGDARAGLRPFVGREQPLSALRRAWDGLRAAREGADPGGPTVLLVSGSAGSGKTRLLTEFLGRIHGEEARGPQVVRISPPPREPYGLWAAVLRGLLGDQGDGFAEDEALEGPLSELGAALDPERGAALLRQRPILAMLLGESAAGLSAEHSPQALGDRIQHAVALCLEGAARRAAPRPEDPPLVVVLDDVHRADDVSLALVGRVLQMIRAPAPLFLAVVARDGGAPDLPLLAPERIVSLGPLADDEAASLAEALSPEARLSAAACAFVVRRAGGNPLFVEELVCTLRDQGLGSASAERLRGFTAPTSLYAMLLERVDRLEPWLRETLRVASVLGPEFERPLFAAAFAAAAAESPALSAVKDPLAALDELERRGLLARAAAASGVEVFAFRQAQMQSAVYGTLLAENRRALHRLAAETLERLHEGRVERHLSRILYHWSQTEEVGRIVHYARLAGQRALGVGAYDEASEDLMMAAALQERLDASTSDPLAPARTLLDLATSYLWSGRVLLAGSGAAEVTSRLEGMSLPEADARGALVLRGRASMIEAQVAELRSRWEASITRFFEAERAFSDAALPFDAARARCCRGFALRTAGRPEDGVELARDGWNVLRTSGNLAAVAQAGHDLGNVLRDLGQYEEALHILDVAVAAGDELRSRGNTLEATWGSLAARSGRGMTYAAMGDNAAAIADQRRVGELALGDGNRIAQAHSQYHLAAHLLQGGALEEAGRVADETQRISLSMGMTGRALKCRLLLARVAEAQGRPEQALSHLEDAEALARAEQLPDEVWFDVAERLVAALRAHRRDDHDERAAALAAEARARAERSASPRHQARARSLGA